MLKKDIQKFLQMDPEEFDQSENGWRSLVGITKEEDIANLILQYIELSHDKINAYNKDKTGKDLFPIELLYFHAGQSFAISNKNNYKRAIQAFKKSYYKDNECWNAYVNGTIAFLEGNKKEVENQIRVVKNSKSTNKKGGNIEILQNFSKCLKIGDTDYSKAYNLPVSPR